MNSTSKRFREYSSVQFFLAYRGMPVFWSQNLYSNPFIYTFEFAFNSIVFWSQLLNKLLFSPFYFISIKSICVIFYITFKEEEKKNTNENELLNKSKNNIIKLIETFTSSFHILITVYRNNLLYMRKNTSYTDQFSLFFILLFFRKAILLIHPLTDPFNHLLILSLREINWMVMKSILPYFWMSNVDIYVF